MWLKVKFYKTGENRKLSPRRTGPWTVLEKMPNGLNFRITNHHSNEEKIVHHDRLTPKIKGNHEISKSLPLLDPNIRNDCETFDNNASSSSSEEVYEPSTNDGSSSEGEHSVNREVRRYPLRHRNQRLLPGSIPWSAVNI